MEKDVLSLHGLPIAIPRGWQDHSIHRYAAPVDVAGAVPAQARLRTASQAPPFRTNMVVARLVVPEALALEDSFAESNRETMAENPSFQILRGPLVGTHDGKKVIWQDTTSREASGALQVFQRYVATMPAQGSLVLVTITSARNDVATLAKLFGFDLS